MEAADNDTRVAITNCHPFIRAFFKLNDEQVDTADNLGLTISIYNILEYSDNYADTTGSLYQYKRPEPSRNNPGALSALENTLYLFKYQSGLVKKQLTTRNSAAVVANIDPNFNAAH